MTSKIKVDNINKVSDDSNIINKCGTNITMGQNGDTVILPNGVTEQVQSGGAIQVQSGGSITIASGATITNNGTAVGLGRTGTVDWATTPVTATFTAANGVGYFANTSGGAFTMNLPAGVVGNIVSVVDYTNTFQTNNLTIAPDGSEKIGGVAATVSLSTEGQSVTFVYVDATEGWKNVQDSTSNVTGNPFMVATVSGACNTLTTSGDFKIATFTGPGTFCVSAIGPGTPSVPNSIDYLIIAGGGGSGGIEGGGGGGAGGFRETPGTSTGSYTVSPIAGSIASFNATVTAFPVVIGGGGSGGSGANRGTDGSNSSFNGNSSVGGGSGGRGNGAAGGDTAFNGNPGGSGGGSGGRGPSSAGSGNTPPTSPAQGKNGGTAKTCSSNTADAGGGGGGATGTALNASNPAGPGGDGGAGASTSITGSSIGRAGGGGGGGNGVGGNGGGASDGGGAGTTNSDVNPGTANTGGGGGGIGATGGTGGSGGSGVVIIRYKFQ